MAWIDRLVRDPALTLQAIQELQLTIPPDQCTDKIFNGKLLELQGKRMQTGQTTTMAVNQRISTVRRTHRSPDLPCQVQGVPKESVSAVDSGTNTNGSSLRPADGGRGDSSVGASCTTSHQRGEEQSGKHGSGECRASPPSVDGQADGDGSKQQEPSPGRAECVTASEDPRPGESPGIHLCYEEGITSASVGSGPKDTSPRRAGRSIKPTDRDDNPGLRGRLSQLQEEITGRPIQSLWGRLKQLKEKMSSVGRPAVTMTVAHVDTTNPSSLEPVHGSQVLGGTTPSAF